MSGARENFYTFALGKKSQGKSLYAKGIAITRARRVVLDPAGTFETKYGQIVGVKKALGLLGRPARSGPLRLVIRPGWSEEIDDVFGAVFEVGNLLFVADEAGDYGAAGSCNPQFLRLMEKGRNRLVDVVTTAQAITALHPKIRNLWDVVVCFALGSPMYAKQTAIDYFHRPELAAVLLELKQFHYLRVVNGDPRIRKGVVEIPA